MSRRETEKFQTFEEFWPFYLREHRHPMNRQLHFMGTLIAITLVGRAAAYQNPILLPWAPVAGYLFAWIGHFLVERNRPATFSYPGWSLRGDFKMFWLMATGRFHKETAIYYRE